MQFRHFAEAGLVQDLAGLGVGGGIDRRRLDAGEVAQHAAGDARVEPQGFERGDQRVAAEGGREPGDAGVGVRAAGGVGQQHVEVGDRAAHRLVEHLVRRSDGGGTRRAGAQRAARLAEAGEEGGARGAGAVAGAAADFEEHGLTGDRGKRQVELREVAGDTGRGGLEVQAGLAQAVVEAGVGERHGIVADLGRVLAAAAGTHGAADLEDVGEVGGEVDADAEPALGGVVVRECQPLEGAGVPQEAGAADVQQVLQDRAAEFGVGDLGVGQVADQDRVVVADRRAQEHRAVAVDGQIEVRQVAGVAVVDALGAARAGEGVAVVVEDREGVAVLQRARAALLQRGGEGNEELWRGAGRGRRRLLMFHGASGQAESGRVSRGLSGWPRPQSDL